MKEGGYDCVKLEGGLEMADRIEAIVKATWFTISEGMGQKPRKF
jgi:ketopantoate hydroxymethyltransferase